MSETGHTQATSKRDFHDLEADLHRLAELLSAAKSFLLELNYVDANGRRIKDLDHVDALVRTSEKEVYEIYQDARQLFWEQRGSGA